MAQLLRLDQLELHRCYTWNNISNLHRNSYIRQNAVGGGGAGGSGEGRVIAAYTHPDDEDEEKQRHYVTFASNGANALITISIVAPVPAFEEVECEEINETCLALMEEHFPNLGENNNQGNQNQENQNQAGRSTGVIGPENYGNYNTTSPRRSTRRSNRKSRRKTSRRKAIRRRSSRRA
jgi:hypothetical protein